MKRALAGQRLVAVFLASTLLFNYPVLSLFEGGETVFGFPPVFAYLFLVWALLLFAVALIVERGSS